MGFSCRDVARRASDHLEGALPLTEALRVRAHLLLCTHCRRYLRQLRAVSGALALLGAGDPIPALPRAGAKPQRGGRGWRLLTPGLMAGLGAGAAAVLALLVLPTLVPLDGRVYAHAMDAHAQPGPPVPRAELVAVLGVVGARLRDDLPEVVFAGRCPLDGKTVAHLLVQTPQGVVVALLLPQRERAHAFERAALHGRFEPFGAGTLVVLAPDPVLADQVAARLHRTVAWE